MRSGIELARCWLELFDDPDEALAAEIAADDYLEHAVAPFGAVAPGRVAGPAHLRATAAWLRDQFPDLRMTEEAIVAAGDLVALRVSSTGTNTGPFNGVLPPTGRSFSGLQSHWFRVEDGRLVEHWAIRDDLSMLLQLGLVEGPVRHG